MENIVNEKKVNYLVEFYKNKDENKYQNFFKTDEDGNITSLKASVKKAIEALELAKSNLETAYANKYANKYVACEKPTYFKYVGRKTGTYYYDITGLPVNIEGEAADSYNTVELETKHGEVNMIDGYCYELASIVVKRYNYNINADNTFCKFCVIRENLIPFLEDEKIYDKYGQTYGVYRWEITNLLKNHNCTQFINGLYGIDRKFAFDLNDMYVNRQKNNAFEIIVKTAPDSLMEDLLKMSVEKPLPVYKILELTQEEYQLAIDKGVEREYLGIKQYVEMKDIFHKTPMEWIEMIEDMKQKQNDLDFFHISYTGYYYRANTNCPLLSYLAKAYSTNEVLKKNYTFGKFCNYVVEESINQGFEEISTFVTELRDYIRMCEDQSIVPTLYSSYLVQLHNIQQRNHKVFLSEQQEVIFAKRYEGFKTLTVGKEGNKFKFLAPKKSDDIKTEADNLAHCAQSYIKRVIDGTTRIFFLRKDITTSLITVEVKNGKIIQARGAHNRKPDESELEALKEVAKKANWVYDLMY